MKKSTQTNKDFLMNHLKNQPKDEQLPNTPKLTPEDWFGMKIEHQIENNQKLIEKFRTELAKDPLYALEWSSTSFKAAALLKVWSMLRATLTRLGYKEGIEVFRKEAEEKVFSGALWPSASTSPSSNYAAQCLTAAWAEVLRELK